MILVFMLRRIVLRLWLQYLSSSAAIAAVLVGEMGESAFCFEFVGCIKLYVQKSAAKCTPRGVLIFPSLIWKGDIVEGTSGIL